MPFKTALPRETSPRLQVPTQTYAVKIASWYAVISALWILCSGAVLHSLVQDPSLQAVLEDVKGWFFVAVTALLLGAALNRYFQEIRRSSELLQASEERWKYALHGASQAVWDWNKETNQVFYSTSWKAMLGFEPSEIGTSFSEWESRVHPDDLARVEVDLHGHLEGRTSAHTSEYRLRCKDGSYKWVLAQGKVVTRTPEGKPQRTIGTLADITERKRNEEALAAEATYRRMLIEGSRDGIVVLDEHARVFEANRRFAESLGYTADEVRQLHVWDWDHRWPRERILAAIREVRPEGLCAQTRHWRKDGSIFDVELSISATELRGEKLVFCVCHDITESKRAEAAMQQRLELQDQVAKIANTVPGMICSFHQRPDGSVCMPFATDRIEEIYGLRPEDVRDDFSPAFARLHPEDLGHVQKSITESARTMGPWHDTFRVRHPQKGELWVEGRSIPRLESDGSILWHGFVQDVTERKRAEGERTRQAGLIESLLDSIPDFVSFKDVNGVYLGCNPPFAELLGRPREQIVGKTDHDLVAHDLADFFRDHDRKMLESLKPRHNEEWIPYSDGRRVLVDTLKTPYWGPDGKLIGTLGISRDITQRKAAEEALRASEERYRSLMEAAFDWIWEVDANGRFTYTSPKVQDFLGYAPEEVVGQTPFDLMPQEEAQRVGKLFGDIIAAKQPFTGLENINRHKNGRLVVLETSGVPLLGPEGELRGYRGMDRDITGRKRLEEQLRQAQKLEGVGQLAGGVAHDFNNVLAAIMMHLGLLQMNPNLDEETRHALKDLDTEARRAAELTRQLLMFSRRSVLAVKPLNLDEVVANLLRMLRRIIGEHIALSFSSQVGLPLVEADAGMLEQVLMNLVVNARDAMPKGGDITIRNTEVEVHEAQIAENPDRRRGRFVCMAVSDTGGGMEPPVLKRVFEPFFTTKEVGKGTGLGLATVHGIVAQHKGWVEVESTVGRGTTFRVFLPALAETTTPTVESAPATPLRRGRETILLVEDDAGVRRTVGQTLRVLGYRVYEAANGQAALDLWQTCGPQVNLVLTDMVMPEGMTGLELIERLRSLKPELRAIISSGYSGEMVQAGLPDKASAVYLPKPYEAKTLAETVRNCLDMKII